MSEYLIFNWLTNIQSYLLKLSYLVGVLLLKKLTNLLELFCFGVLAGKVCLS